MTIDMTKPLQTRRGEKAELVYDGLTGDCPLAVVVHTNNGIQVRTYTRNGVHYRDEDSPANLMNVPEKHEAWINIHHHEDGSPWSCSYKTKEQADYCAGTGRIACVRVEYEKGDGL